MIKPQKEFFNHLALKLNLTKTALYAQIAEYTNSSAKTVEKWGSGETVLGYDKLSKILLLYHSRFDILFNEQEDEAVFFVWMLELNELLVFYIYLNKFAKMLERVSEQEDAILHIMVDEARLLHFLNYKNLAYFKLYVYYYDMFDVSENEKLTYEKFTEELDKLEIPAVFESIQRTYEKIPSREIWGDSALDSLLFHLKEADFRKYFENSTSEKIIREELMSFVGGFFDTVAKAVKPSGVSFDFFKKPYPDGRGFMLINSKEEQLFSMKLDAINGITSESPTMLRIHHKIFDVMMKRSMELGLGDQRMRIEFRQHLINKINNAK